MTNATVLPGESRQSFVVIGDPDATASYPILAETVGSSCWINADSYVTRSENGGYAFELITAGNCRFVQDGREYIIEPGSMFILRKGAASYTTVGPAGFVHKRYVGVAGNLVDILFENFNLQQCDIVTIRNANAIIPVMKQIRLTLDIHPSDYLAKLTSLSYQLLVMVAENHRQADFPMPVQAALNFMQVNLHRLLSIEEIAKAAGVNEIALYRLFTKSMKSTPMKTFMTIKFKNAAQLVFFTRKSMKEIALLHGFEDPSYFTKQFRKFVGKTPLEHRAASKRIESP